MNVLLARSPLSRRQLHVCLATVTFLALLPISSVAAATEPFGFTIGKTTQNEVERSIPRSKIRDVSRSAVTEGPWLEIDPIVFDFDGLEKVVLVFDTDQRLVGVFLTIAKRRFQDVLADLRAKYVIKRQDIDNFMQNGSALFRSDDDEIFFDAPHLSFSLTLTYATSKFWHEMRLYSDKKSLRKRQQERGKL